MELPRVIRCLAVMVLGLSLGAVPLVSANASPIPPTPPWAGTTDLPADAFARSVSPPVAGPAQAAASLDWQDCPTEAAPTLQCARLDVPYVYGQSGGEYFHLAVMRVPATGAKTGSLFFNPGGPGGAGTSAIQWVAGVLPTDIRSAFDLVTWDPRGIGETVPALKNCDPPADARPVSGAVDWGVVRAAEASSMAAANASCQAHNASFIDYMGTNNAARDLDTLRAAVGDKELTYWGMSYGTRIGYVYALMYPTKVRAIVLDGNIDPRGTYAGLTEGGVAPDTALDFVESVSAPTYDSVIATRDGLDAAPIDLGKGVTYTRWSYLDTVMSVMMSQESWPAVMRLGSLIEAARVPGPSGDQARAQLAATMPRENTNAGGAFSVVNCLDYADRMSGAQQDEAIAHNLGLAPVFGGSLTTWYAIGCEGFTFPPDPVPTTNSLVNRLILAPMRVVVSNATNDASTPMFWADKMAASFPRGTYLKYLSGQHVNWNFVPSACINDRIDAYVLNLAVPESWSCPFVRPAGLAPELVPGAPSALVGTPGDHSASIAFTPPAPNGGYAVSSYQYSIDGGATWLDCSPMTASSPCAITGLTNGTTYHVSLRAVNAIGPGAASSPASVTPAPPPPGAVFVPVAPLRAYDSRVSGGPIASGQSRSVDVKVSGYPSGTVAVAYNVTVTETQGAGYLSVTPGGSTSPSASTVNWDGASETLANGYISGVDSIGEVNVSAGGSGSTQFIVDVSGFYVPESAVGPAGSVFVPIDPQRAYDSRTAGSGGQLVSGQSRNVSLAGAGVPAAASGVAYNLTVADTRGSGYLSVTPQGSPASGSAINWTQTGQILANGSQGQVAQQGVTVTAGGPGATQFLVDVTGYFVPVGSADSAAGAGTRFTPVAPARAYDSRVSGGPLVSGASRTTSLVSGTGVPSDSAAVVYNLTLTETAAQGYLSVAPAGQTTDVSTSNWYRTGQTIANGTTVKVDAVGQVTTTAGGSGSTQYLMDVAGYYR